MKGYIENIPAIKTELNKVGNFYNKTLVDAILAVIGKESNFKPQSENLNYSAKRITEVFKSVPANVADTLKNNPIKLGNYVYSNKYGNYSPGDGYLYRGRGFNQITFRDQYKKIGNQLNIDLLNNPDLLNNVKIAAGAAAIYFKNSFLSNRKKIIDKYGIDILNIQPGADPLTILKIAINANAGFGAPQSLVDSEYNKALQYFEYTSGSKPYFIPAALIGIGLLAYLILKK